MNERCTQHIVIRNAGAAYKPSSKFNSANRSAWVVMWCLFVPALIPLTVSGQILPSSPTSLWTAIVYPPGNPAIPDPVNDQQTGANERDIVGSSTHASLFTRFYNGGTPSLTDGQLAFRFRLAQEQPPADFSIAAFVGIDANADGRLDLFLGVDNSGTADHVGIWSPGTGLNTSPSTTSIISPPVLSYAETTANYDWSVVNGTIDPFATNFDLDGGGVTDRFLSFVVPFADVVARLQTGGITIDENSPFAYVAATATQDNSLNADLNGVNGGIGSSSTWAALGGLSQVYTPNGMPVPEPSTMALTFGSMGLLVGLRMFRQRRCGNRS